MSDNTPDEAAESGSKPEEDVVAEETAEETQSSDDSGTKPAIARKTAQAPKRRKKPATPEADDEKIKDLEGDFTDEEQAKAEGIRRRTAKAPVKKKSTATPSQRKSTDDDAEHNPYATKSPATFVKQSTNELKKVVWPTSKEMGAYFVAVLVFVLFIITLVTLLDMLFGWTLLSLLGD